MRFICSLAVLFCFTQLSAQEGELSLPLKGKFTIGGSISGNVSNSETNDDQSSRIIFRPYALIQLDQHWQFGICAEYARSRQTAETFVSNSIGTIPFRGNIIDFGGVPSQFFFGNFPSTETQEVITRSIGACAYGRYTFNPGQRLNVFLEPGFDTRFGLSTFTRDSRNNGRITTKSNIRFATFSVTSGLSYRFNTSWRVSAFAGNLGYSLYWDKAGSDNRYELKTTSFFYNLSLESLRLAVEYTL